MNVVSRTDRNNVTLQDFRDMLDFSPDISVILQRRLAEGSEPFDIMLVAKGPKAERILEVLYAEFPRLLEKEPGHSLIEQVNEADIDINVRKEDNAE